MIKEKKHAMAGLVLLAALAGLMFSGCASAPEKTNPNDCLVVVMCETVNPENLEETRSYRFEFSSVMPPLYANGRAAMFTVGGPDVSIAFVTSSLQGDNFRGHDTTRKVKVPLPYSAGKLAVADYVFVRSYEKSSSHVMSSSYEFRKITEEEREELLAKYRSDKAYAAWF